MTASRLLVLAASMAWLLPGLPAFAQEPGTAVTLPSDPVLLLKSRTFVPPAGIQPDLANQLRLEGTSRIHFLLQLSGPATPNQIDELSAHGIELLIPLRVNGWFASAPRGAILENVDFVRYAGPLLPTDKVEPALLQETIPPRILGPDGTLAIQVLCHSDVPHSVARGTLEGHLTGLDRFGSTLYRGRVSRTALLQLAAEDSVMWIEAGNPVHEPLNDATRVATKAEVVQNAILGPGSEVTYDLSGAGVQVGVFDTGVDPDHDDFQGRLIRTSGTGGHGTHVGGIVGASGLLSDVTGGGTQAQFRGMAPECEIASYDISLDQDDYEEAILTYGVDLTNNSWVQSVDCEYDLQAKQADELVTGGAGRVMTICFGTGNNGEDPQYGVLTGYYSAFTSAKNTIAIGAINSDDLVRTGFSSMGPTFDGRLKPDVVAPGCSSFAGIYSTFPGDSYGYACGTSMSGPATAGCLALLFEKYADIYGVDLDVAPPLPSTMKAILCQTATDLVHLSPGPGEADNPDTGVPVIYHPGPDYATGYGLVNAEAAADLIEEKRLREFEIPSGDSFGLTLNVPSGLSDLKVTIAWDDLPGNPAESNTVPKLINDLDLTLEAPDSSTHLPWVLPPLPHEPYDGSLTGIDPITPADVLPATQGVDSLNNVEQVQVESPDSGTWLIEIAPTNVNGTQKFSLVANVPLPLVDFNVSCDPFATGTGRLELIADLTSLIGMDLPIGATFKVVDCDSSETVFRTIQGKTLRKNASVNRSVRLRLPPGLATNCDLELQTLLLHEGTGETLAVATCNFQIPQ